MITPLKECAPAADGAPRRYDPVKRVLDFVVSAVLLLASLPVQAVVAILVALDLGSPLLFRQPRPGLHGEVFELVKFRTMEADDGSARTDAERLTHLGRLLRASSLDELPTLWNVLRGEMSLIGPRPLRTHYLSLYTPQQLRRHEVRPGITGLAQVSGRNATSWGERLALDVHYVDSRSMLLDLRILARTIWVVLAREGIAAEGHATMTPFTGCPDQ